MGYSHRVFDLLFYEAMDGRKQLAEYLDGLRDRQAKGRILARLERLEVGNFGDCRPCRGGVWELRIDWGPGYRVYYGKVGKRLLLLLAGGDKRTQAADIERAVRYFEDFRRRQR